jgi:hypothetical protein
LGMLPGQSNFNPSPAPLAGPVVPTFDMGNFSADSPTGTQMFQVQYILYAPYGPSPERFKAAGSGILYDMYKCSWWWGCSPFVRTSLLRSSGRAESAIKIPDLLWRQNANQKLNHHRFERRADS